MAGDIPVHAIANERGVHPCCGAIRPDGLATTVTTEPGEVTCPGAPTTAERFVDQIAADLKAVADERYYSGLLECHRFGISRIAVVPLSEHRWYVVKLDVYRRAADGALAGVTWKSPASEVQEDQDRDAVAVEVEARTVTTYRPMPGTA